MYLLKGLFREYVFTKETVQRICIYQRDCLEIMYLLKRMYREYVFIKGTVSAF